jgi:hypothetical protein
VIVYDVAGEWVRITPTTQSPQWVRLRFLCTWPGCAASGSTPAPTHRTHVQHPTKLLRAADLHHPSLLRRELPLLRPIELCRSSRRQVLHHFGRQQALPLKQWAAEKTEATCVFDLGSLRVASSRREEKGAG